MFKGWRRDVVCYVTWRGNGDENETEVRTTRQTGFAAPNVIICSSVGLQPMLRRLRPKNENNGGGGGGASTSPTGEEEEIEGACTTTTTTTGNCFRARLRKVVTSPTDEEEQDFFVKRSATDVAACIKGDNNNNNMDDDDALVPILSPMSNDMMMHTSMNVLLADAECAALAASQEQAAAFSRRHVAEIPHLDLTTVNKSKSNNSGGTRTTTKDGRTNNYGGDDFIEFSRRNKNKNSSSSKKSPVEKSATDVTYSITEDDNANPTRNVEDNDEREGNDDENDNPTEDKGRYKMEHKKLLLDDTSTDICSRKDDDANDDEDDEDDEDEVSASPSEAQSEASFMVLLRYMGLSSRPYGVKEQPKEQSLLKTVKEEEESIAAYKHDLQVGDHVIRWKMLGYCYPIQVHGIVFSVRPDCVTIVDCGLSSSYSNEDRLGSSFDEPEKKKKSSKKERRRMNILSLVDAKEIKQWTKIRYGEEVELKVHSSNVTLRSKTKDKNFQNDPGPSDAEIEQSSSAGLELEEECLCDQAKIRKSPDKKLSRTSSGGAWLCSWQKKDDAPPAIEKNELKNDEIQSPTVPVEDAPPKHFNNLRLPTADPPILVLARLRFLLEYGEEPFPPSPPNDDDNTDNNNYMKRSKKSRPTLLPPHHLLYANSECIAVFCKTGRWSTLQASIFLHTSTFGNAKQTATMAMFLSSQTVTVPASGFWGWFGGTTTISLFSAQPWLVPALVGGGMVYVGLPMLMLWKAKSRWADTEKRLNDAFWSMYDSDITVGMIRCWSGLEG